VIEYEGTLYRPPSEADSLILQATVGCSWNRCAFCAMYREKQFRVRPIEELDTEIRWARDRMGTGVRKVFLADGDALIAKPSYLHAILDRLRTAFPRLRRVSCYASPQALHVRTVDEMVALREAGLTQYYLGVESGHDTVLERMVKGVDSAEMIRVATKAKDAGIKLSAMILLGAGGPELSLEHARESGRVISAIDPRFVSTLVVTPVDGTPLGDDFARGDFVEMDPIALTRELREFVAHTDVSGAVFRSNHASNYLPMGGTLPKDKARIVETLDAVLDAPDAAPFTPEHFRGL